MRMLCTKLLLGATLAAPLAHAVPLTEKEFLPMGAELIKELKNTHDYSDAQVLEFIKTINRISFHPDHLNPKKPEELENRSVNKTFYMAPYFQPSVERGPIGSDSVSTYALKISEGVDELVDIFNFALEDLKSLRKKIKMAHQDIDDYKELILEELDKDSPNLPKIESWQESIKNLKIDIAQMEKDISDILHDGSERYDKISKTRKQELVGSVLYNLAKLGVAPTEKQKDELNSANSQTVLGALAELRLAASRGQFAVRSVVVENGLSESEMEMFSLYRSLRPDVFIKNLPVEKTYVRPVVQTYGKDSSKVEGAFLIREINRSSEDEKRRGLCGSNNVCNVTVEYTEMGARSAITKVNSFAMPVTFVGDVTVKVPEFHGKFDCTLKNGWWAKGRADVKDGGIIYDGDQYNKIHYNDLNKSDCKLEVLSGEADGAEYAFLSELNSWYNALYKYRVMRSKKEKDLYRAKVEKELAWHAKNSQKNKFNWFSRVISMSQTGMGGGWQMAVVGIIGAARNFYWHTRIEDTKVTSEVSIKQEIKTQNMVKTKEFAFDGFPTICFKRPEFGTEPETVACQGKLMKKWDNEYGNLVKVCKRYDSATCAERVEDRSRENRDGFLVM